MIWSWTGTGPIRRTQPFPTSPDLQSSINAASFLLRAGTRLLERWTTHGSDASYRGAFLRFSPRITRCGAGLATLVVRLARRWQRRRTGIAALLRQTAAYRADSAGGGRCDERRPRRTGRTVAPATADGREASPVCSNRHSYGFLLVCRLQISAVGISSGLHNARLPDNCSLLFSWIVKYNKQDIKIYRGVIVTATSWE